MKKIFKKVIKSIRSINLLDGQRIGEIRFRRIFLLVVLYTLVVLVGRLVTTKPDEREVIKEVKAVEYIYKTEDFPELYVVPQEKDSIRDYIKSYGGRIDDNYLAILREYCDEETLRVVVAISVAETSMGKNTDKQANFWGYFYKGNRGYDPDRREMAEVICRGISKVYMNIGVDRRITEIYTGGDRVNTWIGNFTIAFNEMAL